MLSSPGIGSGLDINGIIGQLMAVERRPLFALDAKEARHQTQLTAFGTIKGALSSFQSSITSLAKSANYNVNQASFSDTSLATVSADTSAVSGSYSVEIQALAQSQKLKSANFASQDTTVGSGTLTIEFGTYDAGTFTANPEKVAQSITITPGEATLKGVRDAINDADAGVSASIVNDGSGDRLVIASDDTGLSNALKITAVDDDGNHTDNAGLSQLIYDASTGGISNLSETVAAGNAELVIDGIAISKASNTITDALEGVTLNLLKAEVGQTTTLSVSKDTASIVKNFSDFVDAYNELNETLTNVSQYNAETQQASILTGDFTVRLLQGQVRGLLSDAIETADGTATLSDLGIAFQKDGSLEFDSSKLSEIINDPSNDLFSVFSAAFDAADGVLGTASDSQVTIQSSTSELSGSYTLDISQIATQGTAVGSGVAVTTITASTNDTLDLTIDGVSSSVTLSAGSYDADSLAAEIQSQINSNSTFSSNGIAVSVTQSGGVLTISSNQYGSSSTVEIIGGNGESDLFGTPVETTGLDVVGTINGVAATGSGQTLTGTGDSEGLVLNITGGATGSRGTIEFEPSGILGFAANLDKTIDSMLDGKLIDNRIDGINDRIDDINDQREVLARRLEDVEARLRAQFTALDTLVSNLTQTSNFLQQQLARLPSA